MKTIGTGPIPLTVRGVVVGPIGVVERGGRYLVVGLVVMQDGGARTITIHAFKTERTAVRSAEARCDARFVP